MTTYYFDTSGIVKYYIPEPGSAWIASLADAKDEHENWQHVIAISRLGFVEVAAAIAKRRRTGKISGEVQERTYALFLHLGKQRFTALPIDDPALELAAELTWRHPLRGYDAVHLATALVLNQRLGAARLPSVCFISADESLCQAARNEGLAVENPNVH
jgi:predicted nucleic acid-binding protein